MGSRNKRSAVTARGEKTGLARYYELYLALSNALHDGTYAAGDVLPSEPDLMRQFRLSRSTVRRALHRLQQEKRIVRRHGSGTYASESPDGERTHFSQSSFIDSARALESTTTTRWLKYHQIATPPRLLKLAPDFGPGALHIERARSVRGKPYALLSAYVAPKWGRKLSRTTVGNRATVVALAKAGASFSIAHQYYGALLADQQHARHLAVPVGTPLLHVTSLFREKKGHVTHFEEWYLRSDIHSLHSVIEVA
jgi:GntR family transcriptional regulator